jgi:hypothetical protein
MNPREKMLSLLTAGLVGLAGLYWGYYTVSGWFESAALRQEAAQRELKKKNQELVKVQLAAARLAEFERQSLPRDPDIAQTLYQSWLLRLAGDAGLSDVNIDTAKSRANGKTSVSLGYSLQAVGRWQAWLQFLAQWEAHQVLHRIDSFALEPQSESRELAGTITLSAVCVNSAPASDTWTALPRDEVIPFATAAEASLQRNFFFPRNQPPHWPGGTEEKIVTGKAWSWQPQGGDRDPHDRVRCELLSSEVSELSWDSAAQRLSWTNPRVGRYKLELALTDDGLPAATTKQTLWLNVADPPPPPPTPPATKTLVFDEAPYTVFTAVIEIDGQPEVWLHTRTQGTMHKVHVGETFAIGSVEGKVVAIETDKLVVEKAGKLYQLARGGTLRDLAPLAEPSNAAPSR